MDTRSGTGERHDSMDIGTQINQYTIVEHIGRGGMADVWSARDTRLNRMVAIKTIAHGLSPEVDPVALFKQEAQTIAQMEHPHILPVHDFGDFQGQLYIVMRYMAGGSLEDMLAKGPLPVKEAIRIGTAMAQALDYAHNMNVIHLDLKPPNILLDSSDSPYLADFGLATALNRDGKAMNPGSGTLLYMAPEQLTAELLDKRADIYSFSIMLFHMLTGQLPFDASAPLALKQIQFRQDLPDIDSINPALPTYLSYVLQRGTALDPEDRPASLTSIVNEIRDVLQETSGYSLSGDVFDFEGKPQADMFDVMTQETEHIHDPDILEAVDIYSRARHAWAGGQGKFLLGVTHFMIMNGYYMDADEYGLEIDESGMQMLLRGALEYDQEIEYWWAQVSDESRRWVCLHAIRSGNTPTRVRALMRLEALPDAEKPIIPSLVAQQLQIETHEEARIAALKVLGTRANLEGHKEEFDVDPAEKGGLLTTLTRFNIQTKPASRWRDAVFSPEIDLMLAEISLDYGMPRVAEFAARIVARIHSMTALRHIAEQQRKGRSNALRALAIIRDETPDLPEVSLQAKAYAWISNSLRRMFKQPMGLVYRFLAGFVAGWIAMGLNAYITFDYGNAIFTPDRWRVSIANGLIFGLFTGFLSLLAGEFSRRLYGFWPGWARALVSGAIGVGVGAVAWAQYTWFALTFEPNWAVAIFGGFGIAFGLVMTSLFNLRSWVAIPLTVLSLFASIYLSFEHFWTFGETLSFLGLNDEYALIYYDTLEQGPPLILLFSVILGIGFHLPRLYAEVRNLMTRIRGGEVETGDVVIGTHTVPLPDMDELGGFEIPKAGTQIVPVKAATKSKRPGVDTQHLPPAVIAEGAKDDMPTALKPDGKINEVDETAPRREQASDDESATGARPAELDDVGVTEQDVNQGIQRDRSSDPLVAGTNTAVVAPFEEELARQRDNAAAIANDDEKIGQSPQKSGDSDLYREGMTTNIVEGQGKLKTEEDADESLSVETEDVRGVQADAAESATKQDEARPARSSGPATEVDIDQGLKRPRIPEDSGEAIERRENPTIGIEGTPDE